MAYLYDTLVSALGGNKLIGAQGMDYGSWSPNNYRSVIITADGILVEGHLGGIALTRIDAKKAIEDLSDSRSRNYLNAFELKKLMGLEEVIVDARLNPDITRFMSKAVDSRSRLRHVSVVGFNEQLFKLIVSRFKETRASNEDALVLKMFGLQQLAGQNGPGAKDWFAKVELTGNVYNVDKIGGKLHTHLSNVAEAHGVKLSADEETIHDYTELQIANIQSHRLNVQADIESDAVGDVYRVSDALRTLKKNRGNTGAHSESVLGLARRLNEEVKPKAGEKIPGLGYYLAEFGEADRVPVELSEYYLKNGFAEDETKPSSVKPKQTGGYLAIDAAVKRAVFQTIKSRRNHKVYTPDLERFVPTSENLIEFVKLCTGAPFDYLKYSQELEYLTKNGSGSVLHEYLENNLGEEDEDVQDSSSILLDSLEEHLSKSNIRFAEELYSENIALRPFTYHQGVDTDQYVSDLLTAGLKDGFAEICAENAPKFNAGVVYTEQELVDLLDRYFEGSGVSVTAEDVGTWSPLFAEKFHGEWGVKMLVELVEDASEYSNLKKRQIVRAGAARKVAEGLEEYLDSIETWDENIKDGAKRVFKSLGYTGKGIEVTGTDRVLEPFEFYMKLIKEFTDLNKWGYRKELLEKVNGSQDTWDQFIILNKGVRELIGLPKRVYKAPEGKDSK